MHRSKSRIIVALWLGVTLALPAIAGQAERRQPDRSEQQLAYPEFVPTAQAARGAVFTVRIDGRDAALATMIDAQGLAVTKASELGDLDTVDLVTKRGRTLKAERLGQDRATDLALLRVHTTASPALSLDTPADQEAPAAAPAIGRFLISPGTGAAPVGVGIVSVQPRAIPPQRVLLGVEIRPSDKGPRIHRLLPEMGAAKAGLLQGDIITHVGSKSTATREDVLEQLKDLSKGDTVQVKAIRGDKPVVVTVGVEPLPESRYDRAAHMNRMGGELSVRAHGFQRVIQHDTVLRPDQVGGPVLDLDGQFVGINIARAGRIASYALPREDVAAAVGRMLADASTPAQPQ